MIHPLAITMWDFSWIERRWDGAGFEDWNAALDDVKERGYDAVRIDAFPHLLSQAPEKEWLLLPVWYSNDWGSPYKVRVRLFPALIDFLKACRARRINVALSSWFREDADNVRMALSTPQAMAKCWIDTLRLIANAGLMDTILYVDLCNEFPGDFWAPYFRNDPPWMTWSCWTICARRLRSSAKNTLICPTASPSTARIRTSTANATSPSSIWRSTISG